MELEERARARDASLLARVASIAFAPTCAESIELCLEQAKIRPKDINCVFLDAKADLSWDVEELNDLNQCFQGCPELYLTTTKPLHGSLLAADFAVQLVIAVLALIHQKIPRGLWSENHHKAFPVGRLVLDDPIDKPLKHVLLYARNLDGSAISVLLERP
jgi:3-oxoacyl-(acyl-carrier-protein) synthase